MTSPRTEKTALLMAYSEGTRIFYEAVSALSSTDTRSKLEVRKLDDIAEECRQKVEVARNAMDLHIHKHGC